MKSISGLFLFVLFLILLGGCMGKGSGKKDSAAETDSVSVPDTGFTGIKQYMNSGRLLKEVTFKNGVRQGLTKTYYAGGQLYQTFWYENGLRQDSGRWYQQDGGQLFRSTPYKNDTIDGIAIQYYRTGQIRAKIGYEKGLRTQFFEEYTNTGRLVTDYPEIVASIRDNYKTNGRYIISLEFSNKGQGARFYRGEFTNGRFDTTRCTTVNTVNGVGTLVLKKTGSPKATYVGIIGSVLTQHSNRHLTYKRIDLPYNDLN
ncbi:MAG: hypothetical protein IQL11_09465, partial [Bacteroidales bacterium]|nr:hypothetical protein [Bacteroidales bacterium]